MCKKTKDGYKLDSGRVIKYGDVDFSLLTPDEFKELADVKASLIEVITIKRDVNKILVGIEELKETHEHTKNSIAAHTSGCPIQKNIVYEMIDERISKTIVDSIEGKELKVKIENVYWENLKNKILTTSSMIKAIVAIIGTFLSLGILSGVIENFQMIMKLIK